MRRHWDLYYLVPEFALRRKDDKPSLLRSADRTCWRYACCNSGSSASFAATTSKLTLPISSFEPSPQRTRFGGLAGLRGLSTEPELLAVRWREATGAALKFYAQTAVETLERGGRECVDGYLKRLEGDSVICAMLIDGQGHEVTGRAIADGAPELAAKAMASNRAEMSFTGRRTLAAHSAGDSRGARYVLALELPGGPFRALRPRFRFLPWRIIVVLLAAAFVCYWLARYLAAPVVKLRAATRRVASGDLKVRVGPAIGRRRDELANLGRDFDLMAERIDSLVTAQQRLVSDISHELRSPLARLGVALELARQRAGDEAKGALDRIEREADRLNDLIEQLLTLSRLEIGNQSAPSHPVDLGRLVRQIASDADFEARDRKRAVRVVTSEACQTTGSEELLRRAVENIVRNATRYSGAFKAHFITQAEYGAEPMVTHDPPLLYNLDHDPSEKYNVAANHPHVIAEIRRLAEAHIKAIPPVENQSDCPAIPGEPSLIPQSIPSSN